jgi:hypothetical protein
LAHHRGRKRLLGLFLLEMFKSNVFVANTIESARLVLLESCLAEPVIRHFVEQAVKHSLRSLFVHTILSAWGGEVALAPGGIHFSCNTDHPGKFAEVVRGIAQQSAKSHKNVVNVQALQKGESNTFR